MNISANRFRIFRSIFHLVSIHFDRNDQTVYPYTCNGHTAGVTFCVVIDVRSTTCRRRRGFVRRETSVPREKTSIPTFEIDRPGRFGTAWYRTTAPSILYEQTVPYQNFFGAYKKIPGTGTILVLSTAFFGPFAAPLRDDGARKRTQRAWKRD